MEASLRSEREVYVLLVLSAALDVRTAGSIGRPTYSPVTRCLVLQRLPQPLELFYRRPQHSDHPRDRSLMTAAVRPIIRFRINSDVRSVRCGNCLRIDLRFQRCQRSRRWTRQGLRSVHRIERAAKFSLKCNPNARDSHI